MGIPVSNIKTLMTMMRIYDDDDDDDDDGDFTGMI